MHTLLLKFTDSVHLAYPQTLTLHHLSQILGEEPRWSLDVQDGIPPCLLLSVSMTDLLVFHSGLNRCAVKSLYTLLRFSCTTQYSRIRVSDVEQHATPMANTLEFRPLFFSFVCFFQNILASGGNTDRRPLI